jgi:hypothetical protein
MLHLITIQKCPAARDRGIVRHWGGEASCCLPLCAPNCVGGGLNTHFLASVPADLRAAFQDRLADHLGHVC